MNRDVIAAGFQGFHDCEVCQCYPECRCDCPDHLQCVRRLPEYAERVATYPVSGACSVIDRNPL